MTAAIEAELPVPFGPPPQVSLMEMVLSRVICSVWKKNLASSALALRRVLPSKEPSEKTLPAAHELSKTRQGSPSEKEASTLLRN